MYQPNMEVIYSVDPDLLILEVIPMSGIQNLIERFETDLPVVAVRTYDPNELEVSFKNLGKLLNREREAAEYLAWYKNLNDTMLRKAGKLPEHQKTRLFYKTSFGGPSDVGTLSDKLNYIPARNKTTGCINVASNLPSQGGWVPSVDPEWLASQEIDVLVIGDAQPGRYGFSVNDTSKLADWRSKVMALPVFADTKAVRNERVYMLSESFFGTPRFIVGFAFMAKWCHPELFGDVDPTKIHQEYAMKFLRLGPDIADGGVFVYPEK
jgi:iron complex transport system substrate-binding protein